MLRSLFVALIIVYGIFQSSRGPFYALMFYLWIAYFRPESWIYSDWFVQLNLSLIVAGIVLAGTITSGRRLRFGIGPALILTFFAHALLATLMSSAPDYAWPALENFSKSIVIGCLIITLVESELQLRVTLVVIAASLGFEAVKQGWAQLVLNPGGTNINDSPFLGDNNGVAVGMFMLAPIVLALARTAPSRFGQLVARFAAFGIIYRGLSTYSRGGFLACGALGLQYVARSKQKFVTLVAIAAVSLLMVAVLPEAFWGRMGTITEANEEIEGADSSAQGRIYFWRLAVAMANDHPWVGVGPEGYKAFFNEYDSFAGGDYGIDRAVHSSWFGVLAEFGYPGLLLFLVIVARGLWVCRRARIAAKRDDRMRNLGAFAVGLEGALIAFVVGGSFISFQYNEMVWHVLALSVVVDRLVTERSAALTPAAALAPAPAIRPALKLPAGPRRPIRI